MNWLTPCTALLFVSLAVAASGAAFAQTAGKSAMAPETKKSAKEMAAEKTRLFAEKKVSTWPTRGVKSGGATAVALTASECNWLGGKIVYWPSCGTTNTKCVASHGQEMCIDELPKK